MTTPRRAPIAVALALCAVGLVNCGPAQPVSIALNSVLVPGLVAATPIGGLWLDPCDEFAPVPIKQRWCEARAHWFRSEEEREIAAAAQRPQRFSCRKSLAETECTAIAP